MLILMGYRRRIHAEVPVGPVTETDPFKGANPSRQQPLQHSNMNSGQTHVACKTTHKMQQSRRMVSGGLLHAGETATCMSAFTLEA